MKIGLNLSALSIAISALVLTACGGGGGGDDNKSPQADTPAAVDPSTVTRVQSGQSGASVMVQVANANVDEIAQASNAQNLPGQAGPSSIGSFAKAMGVVTEPMAKPSVLSSFNCAQLGGGTGSGTYSIDSNYDANTGDTNSRITYDQCSYSYAGVNVVLNGYSATQITHTDQNTFVYNTDYDVTYQYSGTYSGNYTYKGNQSCIYTISPSYSYNCSYNIGDTNVSGVSGVTVSGTRTTIGQGTIKTRRADNANSLTITYSNWVYDSTTGRATGRAVVEDSEGNRATIEATANGNGVTYTVTIVYQGNTTTYTVQG